LAVHIEIDLKLFEGTLYTDQYRKWINQLRIK